MINPTDLVRGQKTRKEVEREKRKAELGVCRIRKLLKDGKGCRTVGSGSVIRNLLIDWPGYKDKYCLVTTDKVLPDEDFDVKDFVLDFRKLNSTLREFKLSNYANCNAVFRFTSGLVVIPLYPKGFKTVKKPSIFTFRPFTRESGSSGELFCPTVDDTDTKHFTVRKDFALKHLENQLASNKYVLYDEHSSVSFSTLGEFIGTSNRKPHGAVILSDKECKAVGVLYCPHGQPSRISPIWFSQGNLKPSSVGSPEVVVHVEQPLVESPEVANNPHSNEQPSHNEEVEVSTMDKEDKTTIQSTKSPKKSRSFPESTSDPEAAGTDIEDAQTLCKKSHKKLRSISKSTSDEGSSNKNRTVPIEQPPAVLHTPDGQQPSDFGRPTTNQQPSDFGTNEETSASASVSNKSCEMQNKASISRFTTDPATQTITHTLQVKITTQGLNDQQQETFDQLLMQQVKLYMTNNTLYTSEGLGAFIQYITESRNLALKGLRKGCLEVLLQCPTLESLESLWKDYCSGHLNEVAEKCLVTDEVKMKLNLETVRLKTTITEENYLICKKAVMENSWEAGSTDLSTKHSEADQGGNARRTDASSDFPKDGMATAQKDELGSPAVVMSKTKGKTLLEDVKDSTMKSDFPKDKRQDLSWMVRAEKAKASRAALHKASIRGQYETVKMLLESGEDVEQKDEFSLTPLHLACWYGQESVVKLLLEHGADINALDRFHRTPLQKAEYHNHQSIVQLLLRSNANPSYQQPLSLKTLSKKAFLHVDTQSGFNRLQAAVFEGEDSIVNKARVFLDNFVKEMNLKTTRKGDILLSQKKKGPSHAKINNIYQEEVENENTLTDLHWCKCGENTEQAVELVLNYSMDINIPALGNLTPLLWASPSSSNMFIKTLIDLGADVNAQRTDDKASPLHFAASWNHYMVTRLLLEHGADANIQDCHGYTPLHWSVMNGNENLIKLLLKNNADVNIQDRDGYTPLHLSVKKGDENLVKLLLEHNADVNMKDSDGDTPLHLSVKFGYENLDKLLLEHSEDVNIKDS